MSEKYPKRKGEQCVSVTLPELLQLSNRARQLSLSASRVNHSNSGQHLSRFFGRGMEFAESRRYHPGDDIRMMDWRVTARTGKAHTKLFAAEKERQVLLCIDLRSSMFFATKGVFKSVQAALMAGYVAWNASQTGNRVGGIIFDDTNLFEYRPALGKRGVLPLLQGLAEHANFSAINKERPLQQSDSIMDQAIAHLRRVAAPGSLIFIISDFRSFSSSAQELVLQQSKHSDICLCFPYDTLEVALPSNGYYPVTDGTAEWQLNTYDKKRMEKYRQQFVARKSQAASLSRHNHIHFLECSTESDCFEVLWRMNSR